MHTVGELESSYMHVRIALECKTEPAAVHPFVSAGIWREDICQTNDNEVEAWETLFKKARGKRCV